MEKPEKIKVTNANQFEKLVEELQKNPSLAVGFRRGTVPSNFKAQWEEIGKVLNSLGPPIRLGDGWQKVWRDLKFKVKKKMVANKVESPLEKSVANLLQFQKQLNSEGVVQGIKMENSNDQFEETEHELQREVETQIKLECSTDSNLIASVDSETIQPATPPQMKNRAHLDKKIKNTKNKDKTKCNCHSELLHKHSTEQAKLLTDISKSLGSIKRSLEDVDKRQRHLLEVEEKKLKLLEERNKIDKERNKREEEIHENDLKIKKLEILIKEKELKNA